jgi:hypothetical protein
LNFSKAKRFNGETNPNTLAMDSMPASASPQEDEVKRAAELKEWLESRISELEVELARLKDMMALVDSTLRRTSFVPAAVLRNAEPSATSRMREEKRTVTKIPENQASAVGTNDQSRQLRRSKDGKVLANAFVDAQKIVITPEPGLKFSQITPPFQTFFVNRILKGYQAKDEEMSKNGSLSRDQVMNFNIEESEGNISVISITNYRERVRLNEILSTATWAFSRMLEKR